MTKRIGVRLARTRTLGWDAQPNGWRLSCGAEPLMITNGILPQTTGAVSFRRVLGGGYTRTRLQVRNTGG